MSSPSRQEGLGEGSGIPSGSGSGRRSGWAPSLREDHHRTLSREEEAYQDSLLAKFREELKEELEKVFPDDEAQAKLALENTMAQARKRIP